MLLITALNIKAQNSIKFNPDLKVGDRIEIVNKKVLGAMEKLSLQLASKIENAPDTLLSKTLLTVTNANDKLTDFSVEVVLDDISKTMEQNLRLSSDEKLNKYNVRLDKSLNKVSIIDSAQYIQAVIKSIEKQSNTIMKSIDSLKTIVDKSKEKNKSKKKASEDDAGMLESFTMMGLASTYGSLVTFSEPQIIYTNALSDINYLFVLANKSIDKNSETKISTTGSLNNFNINANFHIKPSIKEGVINNFEILVMIDTVGSKAQIYPVLKGIYTKLIDVFNIVDPKSSSKNTIDKDVNDKLNELFMEDPNLVVSRYTVYMDDKTQLPHHIVVDKKQMIEPTGTEEEKMMQTYDTSVTNVIEIKVNKQ